MAQCCLHLWWYFWPLKVNFIGEISYFVSCRGGGGVTKLELSLQRNIYFTPSCYHDKSQAQVKICQEGRAENTILVTETTFLISKSHLV